MLRILRLLLGLEHPTRRELMATRDACEALEARVEAHYAELKTLRGRINAFKRWEESHEDAPGDANADSPDIYPQPAAPTATAHLARRFRGF